jgi:hypothetical protein
MHLPNAPRSCPHLQVKPFLAIRILPAILATAFQDNLANRLETAPKAQALPISFPQSTLTNSTPKSLATKQTWIAFLRLGTALEEGWNRPCGLRWVTKEEVQRQWCLQEWEWALERVVDRSRQERSREAPLWHVDLVMPAGIRHKMPLRIHQLCHHQVLHFLLEVDDRAACLPVPQ